MDMLKKTLGIIFLAVLLGFCANCGGGGGTSVEPPPSQSAAVAIGYVATAKSNTVTSFLVNESTGALTKGTTLPTGDFPGFSAVTPDRKMLFVSNMKGGTISRFSLDGRGGMQIAGPVTKLVSSGAQPSQLAISPSGKYLFVGTASSTIEAFRIEASGDLTPLQDSPVPASSEAVGLAISHSGQFLFVTGSYADPIDIFSIDSLTGKLTALPTSPLHTGFSPCAMSLHPSDKYLLVNACVGKLLVFSIQESGMIQEIVGSRLSSAYEGLSIAIAPNGRTFYIDNMFWRGDDSYINNGILAFAFDPSTGIPTSIPGSPFSDGQSPSSVAVSPTGKILIVSRINPGHIAAYRIDQNTGALTSISGNGYDSGLEIGNSPNHVVLVPSL